MTSHRSHPIKLTVFTFFPLVLCLFLAGCSSSSDNGGSKLSPFKNGIGPAANTCDIVNSAGKLPNGLDGMTIMLYRDYLSQADQQLFHEGTFPDPHTFHREYDLPSRRDLLKSAAAWKWSIGPAKDAAGNWTKLSVWKEILYAANSEGYYLDLKVYDYGEPIAFTDPDSGLYIECNIPAN